MAQADVKHHLGREGIESQTNVMGLLCVEVRITVCQHGGVGTVNIRIQIGNTRT